MASNRQTAAHHIYMYSATPFRQSTWPHLSYACLQHYVRYKTSEMLQLAFFTQIPGTDQSYTFASTEEMLPDDCFFKVT